MKTDQTAPKNIDEYIAGFPHDVQEILVMRCEGIISWLTSEYGLGHGHATAIVHVIAQHGKERVSTEDAGAAHFAGKKVAWRKPYDALVAKLAKSGTDFEVAPTKTYISLLRGSKKFAILQLSAAERLDIGIKLKGVALTERLEAGGSCNNMVTHRVGISAPKEIGAELLAWLKEA